MLNFVLGAAPGPWEPPGMAVLLEELLVRVGVKASDGPGGQEGRNSFLFVERGW